MELIRKQVRMNQIGKIVTDQFMIDGDYNVPDAKSDVGSVLSSEGSLRIEETRRVENYLRVTGKLNFKVLYGYFKIYFNNYSDSFSICFFKFYNKIHFKEVNNISFGNCNNNFIYIINLNSIYELYG